MGQNVEITLVGMNEIAREGLTRILISEQFKVGSLSIEELEVSACERKSTKSKSQRIFVIDRELHEISENLLVICGKVKNSYPDGRVAILSEILDFDEIASVFAWGADGYILKSIACKPLFGLLNLIALGEKVLPSQIVDNLRQSPPMSVNFDWSASARSALISRREEEILVCVSQGMANKVISRQLKITEATVKIHVKAILRKLHVSNRTQAAIWAVQRGLSTNVVTNGACLELSVAEADGDPHENPIVVILTTGLEGRAT